MISNRPFANLRAKPLSPLNPAVVNLIWINVIVFVSLWILSFTPIGGVLFSVLAFSPTWPIYLSFYSVVTSLFVHAGLWHILGNMLWLYFVGIILEDLLGKKHIWKLFFGGGISGVMLFYILSVAFNNTAPLVGASAGISAILVATAIFTPNYRVYLFGIIAIELRWIVVAKIVFDVLGMFGGLNAGGSQAHVGGYIFGALYITELKGIWNFPKITWKKTNFQGRPSRSANVSINNQENSPSQEQIDQILDKISKSGYDKLSKKEKEMLFKASKK